MIDQNKQTKKFTQTIQPNAKQIILEEFVVCRCPQTQRNVCSRSAPTQHRQHHQGVLRSPRWSWLDQQERGFQPYVSFGWQIQFQFPLILLCLLASLSIGKCDEELHGCSWLFSSCWAKRKI